MDSNQIKKTYKKAVNAQWMDSSDGFKSNNYNHIKVVQKTDNQNQHKSFNICNTNKSFENEWTTMTSLTMSLWPGGLLWWMGGGVALMRCANIPTWPTQQFLRIQFTIYCKFCACILGKPLFEKRSVYVGIACLAYSTTYIWSLCVRCQIFVRFNSSCFLPLCCRRVMFSFTFVSRQPLCICHLVEEWSWEKALGNF